ncbi:MAG TPA: aspartate aminotransferase family protein, partial [Rubrobacteraceae bacterium]
MRGVEQGGRAGGLTGADNLLLHFTPFAEDRSKLPVIVSGEGCYVTDDRGRTYVDGLAGMFTNQLGNGRGELGEVAARQMKELGFFPNWG